jgi:hypothetical protein
VASYQQLTDDVCGWLNRKDIVSLIPGWPVMVETEIAETLRARCMVVTGKQPIDSAYITMPPDFATMDVIRDATSGELLELKDEWSGHWTTAYADAWPIPGLAYAPVSPLQPCVAYRLTGNLCIEFLPHPAIPDPPDPNWVPQQVLMAWYQKPAPLILPADTNPVLENLYAVYLWGLIKHGALFEMDNDRAAQADNQWQAVVTRANLWKQQSDYSGAPFRSELACHF